MSDAWIWTVIINRKKRQIQVYVLVCELLPDFCINLEMTSFHWVINDLHVIQDKNFRTIWSIIGKKCYDRLHPTFTFPLQSLNNHFLSLMKTSVVNNKRTKDNVVSDLIRVYIYASSNKQFGWTKVLYGWTK